MRARRIANRSRGSTEQLSQRCVYTRTPACGESAAPGNSTAFVWVLWKGRAPASEDVSSCSRIRIG
jgi:hypothetical protein